MIKVLVVEDSAVQREILLHILQSDPMISVIGTAKNGEEALELLTSLKPDVITMDIHMPKMDGVETTRRIMTTKPIPIVIVSSSNKENEKISTFQAIEEGAVAVADKPVGPHHPNYQKLQENLLKTVKLMSEVKVVRRWTKQKPIAPEKEKLEKIIEHLPTNIQLIAIGVSTGGPPVLHDIFMELPQKFPPILVVQHITTGFLSSMVDWLTNTTQRTIQIADDKLLPQPSTIYFAPDNSHMGVNERGVIFLSKHSPENGLRPSVSFLFRTVADTMREKAMGILLTGMGKDGAEELKSMRQKGAITLAQNKETSLVYGMPKEAAAIGAAAYILSPKEIAEMITLLAKPNS